jgi:NADPH2:quinone reductase
MKEALVDADTKVQIIDSPIPTPTANQVLIHVAVSGSNPKDWKVPNWLSKTHNSGDDIAGTIASVGPDVWEFKPGDRVAAFHEMVAPHGSFAEYAIAYDYATFKIPESVEFEEAATVPLAALTAAIGLFLDLKVAQPWGPPAIGETKEPLLVYGASAACGAFAAQLGKMAGLSPIIGVAGRASEFAGKYCDVVVDYRADDCAKQIASALEKNGVKSGKVKYVFDAISEQGSHEIIALVVSSDAVVSHLLPKEKWAKSGPGFKYPEGVKDITTSVGGGFKTQKDFAYVLFRFLSRALADGRFKGHPFEVVKGGLDGVEKGLKDLRDSKASGLKYVFRIPETAGAGKDKV